MKTLNWLLSELSASENNQAVRVQVLDFSKRRFEICGRLNRYFDGLGVGSVEVINELSQELDLASDYDTLNDGLSCTVKLNKRKLNTYVTAIGFAAFIRSARVLPEELFLHFQDVDFTSLACRFIGRRGTTIDQIAAKPAIVPALNYTKPLNSGALLYVPENLLSWICTGDNFVKIPIVVRSLFAQKLFVSFSTEVIIVDDTIELFFRGDKTVKISKKLSEDAFWNGLFEDVQKISGWVFSETNDPDTRHAILNAQLSLSNDDQLIDTDMVKAVLDKALTNSMLSYRFHLVKGSKNLNKVLTELNKTLFDHIGKIRQNTSDLITGLWRDFTTVFALLILNFSIKKPDLPLSFWNFLFSAISIYLIISFFLTSRMGFWFYRSVKDSLTVMKVRVYSYMDDIDFKDHALIPLAAAQSKFRTTFFIVLVCYVGILSALFYLLSSDVFWSLLAAP